jgi:uncharacterized paraquat-inducible protein A
MDIGAPKGFNERMTRCTSCDGILAKHETVCYSCGEPVPGRQKSKGSGLLALIPLVLIVSLGIVAYSYLGQ